MGQNYAWRSKTTDTQEPEILTMLIDNWYNEVRMNEEIHILWPHVLRKLIQRFQSLNVFCTFLSG